MDASPPAGSWPDFSLVQRRVLGVLVEKAKTTPDAYPLSLNGLTTGCNQKSNRDPVLNLSDDDVEQCLHGLQKIGLTTLIQGGRVERWKHNLYEQWQVGKIELAILAELLLRGPQTEGELRSRASRMEPIDDLDILRQTLKPMAERGLAVWLGEEGRRGALIAHGFCSAKELEAVKSRSQAAAPALGTVAAPSLRSELTSAVEQLRAELTALQIEVQHLGQDLRALSEQFQQMKTSLGA